MLKALKNYVILKKEKAENTTASGIILTTPEKQAGNVATVLGVGSQCDEGLKAGMRVIFKEYAGTKYEEQEEEYIILKDDDVLAIIA